MQPLPFRQQWIVGIDQKGVVELLPQAFFEGAKAGKSTTNPQASSSVAANQRLKLRL